MIDQANQGLFDGEFSKSIIENDTNENLPNPILSKDGKQNKANEYVDIIRYKQNGDKDPCQFLKELKAKTKDTKEISKINLALKRFDCDGKDRFDKGKKKGGKK